MHPYHQPVELSFDLPTRVYAGMLTVWLLRPNLQKKFPLHKNKRSDYLGFLAWCTMIGRRECRLLTEIDAWNCELQKPVDLPNLKDDPWSGTFTVGMYLVGLHRSKYWDAQIQANPKLRHRTARWYFREGRQVLDMGQIPVWQMTALKDNFQNYKSFRSLLGLPNDDKLTERVITENSKDIEQRWNRKCSSRSELPVSLLSPSFLNSRVASAAPILANQLLTFLRRSASAPSTSEVTEVAKRINEQIRKGRLKKGLSKPYGVNLFGYAKGELGIGEDVRMLALALEAVNVPFCVINIELGKDISQQDSSATEWLVEKPQYSINIFCMTGIEMCRYIAEAGTQWYQAYYNIGLWPWELPLWPEPWHHAWTLVNELWGISHYTAESYAEAPVPVTPVPLPVVIKEVAPLERSHWALPDDAYLFVYSFDINSRPTRKNPQAVIQAFKQAAKGMGENEVGLVLKVSHLKPEKPEWKALEKLIGEDPRIHLITTELRRPEVLALYRNCNCYVSLHRSEGFGRGLAEAQLLGLQLIATGYSGNMEFCGPPTQCVDYKMINLGKDDYFYGEGQQWADPDVDHAAMLMKDNIEQGKGINSVQYDIDRFSPSVCGRAYAKRFEEIFYSVNVKGYLHEQ